MEYVVSILGSIGLWILGAIYNIVSYAYSVFILMCSLNFSVIEGIAAPLIDRLEALVMVFVAFKVGVALIQYMLDPDKAIKGGAKLVTNILITAILLISRNFIFSVFNELSLLIMGNPTNYPLTVLASVAEVTGGEDEGLIMRFVFDKAEKEDIGEYLAYSTVSIFVRDYDGTGKSDTSTALRDAIATKDGYNFRKMSTLGPEINRKVEYTPFLGTAVGIYLIFALVKSAIEIGVRMFKLLILQILAPVAIITCVDGGFDSKTFKSFYSTYLSVWVEAFTRMLVMLISVVFVSKFFLNIGEFFGDLTTGDVKIYTKSLITILVVISAFKFATDVPKFIDQVLGTKMASGNTKNVVGGLLGFGAGAVAGLIGGAAGGGVGGALAGLATGGFKGATSGSKGNNVAEFFKGQRDVRKGALSQGQDIAARGGLRNVMLGNVPVVSGMTRNAQDRELARLNRQSAALEALEAAETFAVKDSKMSGAEKDASGRFKTDANGNKIYNNDYDQKWSWTDSSGKKRDLADTYYTGYSDIKLGDDKDAYAAKMLEFDRTYQSAQAEYDRLSQIGTTDSATLETARQAAQEARGQAIERAKTYYDGRKLFESDRSDDVRMKRATYTSNGGQDYSAANRTAEKRRIYKEKSDITNSTKYKRTHGQNPDK